MTISVVTTFHEAGLKQYGQRMINTFVENWPSEVKLFVYPEKCNPHVPDHNRIVLTDLDSVPELTAFKNKWKGVPKANGDVTKDPVRSKRRDAGKGFKWDAVRFAHKVYSIFDCAKKCNTEWLIWMDADTICHSPISYNVLQQFLPSNQDLCYLGRKGKYSECGLYAMKLTSPIVQDFLKEFQLAYDAPESNGGIFTMAEWHDSFVFDGIRQRFPKMKQYDWATSLQDLRPRRGMSQGEGHPLINSDWGAYLDHLKGNRKTLGKSKRDDLKVPRTEPYWQQFR